MSAIRGRASVTRKGSSPISVWVLPSEKADIARQARSTGHSTSAFLRKVGLGYPVPSILDAEKVDELARVNADQGRLGGLLKMWLSSDDKLRGYDSEQLRQTITGCLLQIRELQDRLFSIVKQL